MTQRMFVAALPPSGFVEDLDGFLDVRREAARGGFRWTLPEQWHLTLAFLPEVPDRALDDLLDNLTRAAGRRRAPVLRLGGGGAFPDVARAKVLWLGVQAEDPVELDLLAAGCRTAASTAGVPASGERFRPHLTLARTAKPVEATRWVRVLDSFPPAAYRLEEIALVASHLGEGPRGRPRHEIVTHIRVGSDS